MTYRFLLLALLSLTVFTAGSARAQVDSLSIAAVVNEDAISGADVRDRLRLILVSSGLPDSAEMREKALNQVIDSLVDEQIKMQEAARNNLTVTEEDIDKGFAAIAANNKMSPEQFTEVLKGQKISRQTLNRQIKAQIAWTKVVQSVIRAQVSVSQNDVAAMTERMKANIGKTEYLVSEIFLPIDRNTNEGELRQFASRVTSEISAGKAVFGAVALQVSRGAGAEKGGDIGWVQEGRLPQELDAALKTLAEGQVSEPIRGSNGYHILQLRQKRTFTEENIPSNDVLMNQIGFERLDRAQQRYLTDLKAAAFIDRRV